MYLQILKKDLKRNKAMNVILLVFIILASMFVSSSVNNIISVTTALDDYLEMENAPDYFVATMNKSGEVDADEILNSADSIDRFSKEKILFMEDAQITFEKEGVIARGGMNILQSDKDLSMHYVLDNKEILKTVKSKEFYMTANKADALGLEIGDKITIKIGDISQDFTLAGKFMDAVLGANASSIQRFIIGEEDYEKFISAENIEKFYGGEFIYIHSMDTEKLLSQITPLTENAILTMDRSAIKFTYVIDMLVTGILLVVSLVLIAVAFVVLRFTISFTLSEEFREIGVMKTIGIRNLKIRGLYLTKYVALAVIGAMIGLVFSFPFGNMLMEISSKSIIIGSQNTIFVNIICVMFVIGIILLFCFNCTSKVKKMTPIDAVRNGQSGERFRKRSVMRLEKSRLSDVSFLALNDIASSPKRFGIIALTFVLCLLCLLILSSTVSTMKSGTLINAFHLAECDIVINVNTKDFFTKEGHENLENFLEEMEEKFKQDGMPSRWMQEVMLKLPVSHGDNMVNMFTQQGSGTTADMYTYMEGTPPQSAKEVALTRISADKLKANIGDTITIKTIDGDKKYIITAIYQSLYNMGEGLQFHEDETINYIQAIGITYTQIQFTDNPDDKEIERRIEKIKERYPEFKGIKACSEYLASLIGVTDTLDAIKNMVAIFTIILAAMITVLMERSFIAKEKGEIALMKAFGMRNAKIYSYHILRFVFVGIIATIIAELLALPFTHLFIDPIFKMMGLELAVDYVMNPFEMFLVYPLVILAATTISAFLTSLYTKRIKSMDTANIE